MSSAPPPRMSAPMEAPPGPPKRSFPWGWILLGVVGGGCGLCAFGGAILFPVFAQARESMRSTICASRLKAISLGVELYASDNDDALPAPGKWMDLTGSEVPIRMFHCPSVSGRGNFGYAFNKALAGKKVSEIKPTDPMIFDSTILTWNANSGLETLPSAPRHTRGGVKRNFIAYREGKVRPVPR